MRALILWLILLGTCALIPQVMTRRTMHDPEQWQIALSLIALPLSVAATCWASLRLPARPANRLVFWIITQALWLLIALFFLGGLQRANIATQVPLAGMLIAALVSTPVLLQLAFFRQGVPARHRGWFWSLYGLAWLLLLLFGFKLIVPPDSFPGMADLKIAHTFLIGLQLAGVVILSLRLHLRRWPARQTRREIFTAFTFLPLIGLVAWLHGEMRLRTERQQALAAWANSGHPLGELDPKFAPREANGSAARLDQIVEQWQRASIVVPGRTTVIGRVGILAPRDGQGGDAVDLPFSWPLADDFDSGVLGFGTEEENFRLACQEILAADPPVFGW